MKIKKILILIVIFVSLLSINTFSIAVKDLDYYKPTPVTQQDAGESIELGKRIIGGITVVGIVVSISVVMILGIKYMVGSVEQKAEYKKTMIPVIVGMMLLFGTSWIIKILYEIVPSNIS